MARTNADVLESETKFRQCLSRSSESVGLRVDAPADSLVCPLPFSGGIRVNVGTS